jgi:hypothetical protein
LKEIENPMVLGNQPERKHWGVDSLGNEVFEGEEIIKIDDHFILKEVLNTESIQFMVDFLGAEVVIAGSN